MFFKPSRCSRSTLFLLSLILLVAGCGKSSRIPADVLVIAQSAEPRSLDPHVATGNLDFRICNQIYEGLVRFKDGTLEIEPALAESWTISNDGKSYTFKLKQDILFHDGTPFNASSVKFNFERMLDENHPFHNTGPFPLSFFFSVIEKVAIVDDWTVRFDLRSVYAPFLANLAYPAGFIVSPRGVEKHGQNIGRNPIGTGPFVFAQWNSQRSIKLIPNRKYRTPHLTNIREIYFRPINDENTRLTELLAGEVDVLLELPSELLSYFKNKKEFKVSGAVGPHLWFLILNTRDPPFNDKRVRQAVNYAINKKAIVNRLLQGTAEIPNGPVPSAFAWAHDKTLSPYPYDPQKAKELIRSAGAQGTNLTLLATESGSGMLEPKQMAVAIQSDLKDVGLNVSIELYEWNSYLAKVNKGLTTTEQMAQMAWMTNDPDTLPYLALRTDAFPGNGGFNSGYYSNARVDELLEKARAELDLIKRAALYKEVQKVVHADAPWAFIASWNQVAVARRNVDGFQLQPSFLFNLSNVRKGGEAK